MRWETSLSFIIYCLNCIRRDRNSTYKTGLNDVYNRIACYKLYEIPFLCRSYFKPPCIQGLITWGVFQSGLNWLTHLPSWNCFTITWQISAREESRFQFKPAWNLSPGWNDQVSKWSQGNRDETQPGLKTLHAISPYITERILIILAPKFILRFNFQCLYTNNWMCKYICGT
jgi:hypothetical protein